MKIKDLVEAGFIIQERTSYANVFSEIVDLEELEGSDLSSGNYETGKFEIDYSSCEVDLYVEGKGDCGIISFSDFEDALKDSNNVSEFMKNFKEKDYKGGIMKIKDLIKAGAVIKERAKNVSAYSGIENIENLEISDLKDGNYATYECDVDYSCCDVEFYVELEYEGGFATAEELEDLLNTCHSPIELVRKLRDF